MKTSFARFAFLHSLAILLAAALPAAWTPAAHAAGVPEAANPAAKSSAEAPMVSDKIRESMQDRRYADAVAAIVRSEREGVPVLVHCYAGTQRTGGCLSFYRLLVRRDPPASVYQDLGRYGWDAATDQVLVDYVNSNMRTMADLLVQRQVLDRIPEEMPRLQP